MVVALAVSETDFISKIAEEVPSGQAYEGVIDKSHAGANSLVTLHHLNGTQEHLRPHR
jgi:hypothetical protein